MDSSLDAINSSSTESPPDHPPEQQLDDSKTSELSSAYVGRWSTLVSTTNWEKGKIILEWREALRGSESPATAYSDEAWSRRVGGVTSQHVGRLRRVYERFGRTQESYPRLYWSHFLSALDWDDAEMWLEGATQSQWSVSQMRQVRWEASGGDPALEAPATEVAGFTDDEDFVPLAEVDDRTGKEDAPRNIAEGPRYDEPDFGDEGEAGSLATSDDREEDLAWDEQPPAALEESPFAKLPSLPVDMAEALEQFKLSIIRHRADGWGEVSPADVLQALEALKLFALQ